MAEGLIIVESPAKARTLKRFLGDRFDVRASMGHVRDLPERELAVDVEQDFQPRYEVVEGRKQTISDLKKAVKGQREVILASDPDREGEAIAWHLSEVLRLRTPKRIEFHEITSEAVRRALDSPREIDMRLVDAYQARRVVDREDEIRGFTPEESWTVDALLSQQEKDQRFKARLARRLAEPDARLELKTEAEAQDSQPIIRFGWKQKSE